MHKVAVYGTLRAGCGNNVLLSNAKFIGKTLTEGMHSMYSLGGCPAVKLSEPSSHIVIEVYEVDDATLSRLDRLEGYRGTPEDSFYNRSVIGTVGYGDAFIYHIEDRDFNHENLIEDGDWVRNRARRVYY